MIHEIKQILCDPAKGLGHLLKDGTPILVLEGVIRKIVQYPVYSLGVTSCEVYERIQQIERLREHSAVYAAEAAELEAKLLISY